MLIPFGQDARPRRLKRKGHRREPGSSKRTRKTASDNSDVDEEIEVQGYPFFPLTPSHLTLYMSSCAPERQTARRQGLE